MEDLIKIYEKLRDELQNLLLLSKKNNTALRKRDLNLNQKIIEKQSQHTQQLQELFSIKNDLIKKYCHENDKDIVSFDIGQYLKKSSENYYKKYITLKEEINNTVQEFKFVLNTNYSFINQSMEYIKFMYNLFGNFGNKNQNYSRNKRSDNTISRAVLIDQEV